MSKTLLAPLQALSALFDINTIFGIWYVVGITAVLIVLLRLLRRRFRVRWAVAVPVAGAITIVVASALLVAFTSLSELGRRDIPTHELALERLNACPAARAALETPIRQASRGKGMYETKGMFGASSWGFEVSGPKRTADFQYAAEMHGGRWSLTRMVLRVDGKLLDLADCM